MEGALAIFAILVLGVLARAASYRYRAWRIERNELPDEDRAQLFWNDRNYERLQFGITAFWWSLAGLLALMLAAWFSMPLWLE